MNDEIDSLIDEYLASTAPPMRVVEGGAGSGNFGHSGRVGSRGGSGGGGGGIGGGFTSAGGAAGGVEIDDSLLSTKGTNYIGPKTVDLPGGSTLEVGKMYRSGLGLTNQDIRVMDASGTAHNYSISHQKGDIWYDVRGTTEPPGRGSGAVLADSVSHAYSKILADIRSNLSPKGTWLGGTPFRQSFWFNKG